MAENKMKEVAKLLGVELGEKFEIENSNYNPYVLNKDGLRDHYNLMRNVELKLLLTGEYEIKRPILNSVEKRYLEGVLKPFKNRILHIIKHHEICCDGREYIMVILDNGEFWCFPYFEKNTMYKGMEPIKEYTLQELGLFDNGH